MYRSGKATSGSQRLQTEEDASGKQCAPLFQATPFVGSLQGTC